MFPPFLLDFLMYKVLIWKFKIIVFIIAVLGVLVTAGELS